MADLTTVFPIEPHTWRNRILLLFTRMARICDGGDPQRRSTWEDIKSLGEDELQDVEKLQNLF